MHQGSEPEIVASRMQKLDASGIRKVFDLAEKMENPVNLSIGQPDFDIPDEVKSEATSAIEAGQNRYTVTQGIEELREKLRAKLRRERGIEVKTDNILITSGVSGGLVLAFLVLVERGDEVLITDPYFVMYKHLTNLAGGTPRFIDTYPDFRLTRERLLSQITPNSKIIVVNSPANPTGYVYSREELLEIIAVAQEHNLLLISDEIYDMFVYDEPYTSVATLYDKTLLLNGFSKSHAMTGWRLGYAVGPPNVIAEMTKLQQFSFVCAPSFAQVAGVKALDIDTSDHIAGYKKRRDLLVEGMKESYEVVIPDGAFYAFPKTPWGTGQEFVAEAIKNDLLIIPGGVFSEKDTHFRISYSAPIEAIERGIEILNMLARKGPPKE